MRFFPITLYFLHGIIWLFTIVLLLATLHWFLLYWSLPYFPVSILLLVLGAAVLYIFLTFKNKFYIINFIVAILVYVAYLYAEYEDDSMSWLLVIYAAVPYIFVAYILLLIHYIYKRK
jgi:hypothetical protein